MAPQEVELAGLIIALGLIRLVRSAFARAQGPKQRTPPQQAKAENPPEKAKAENPQRTKAQNSTPKVGCA